MDDVKILIYEIFLETFYGYIKKQLIFFLHFFFNFTSGIKNFLK